MTRVCAAGITSATSSCSRRPLIAIDSDVAASSSPTCASRAGRRSPKPASSSVAPGWERRTCGHAATSRSTPLLRSSLPTKSTRGEPSVQRLSAADAAGPSRPKLSSTGLRGDPLGQRPHLLERLRLGPRAKQPRVDPRRPEPRALGQVGVADGLPEVARGVPGADQEAGGGVGALPRVGDEAIGMRAHRVGEVRAVHLDRELQARAGDDHGPHDQVVGEHRIGCSDLVHNPPDRLHVRGDVAVELAVVSSGNVFTSKPS